MTATSAVQTESRRLHFDLSHCPPGSSHTLHRLGRQPHRLTAHSEHSRQQHRAASALLEHVPDTRLTHFAELDLPQHAVQSYWITHERDGRDLPALSLLALHVPKQAVRDQAQAQGVQASVNHAKARQLGLLSAATVSDDMPAWANDGDLADFTDFTDAAKFIVFHHPELLCFEPATVVNVLAKIESTHAFEQLVEALYEAGSVVDPDTAEEGYEGWATASYTLDPDGKKIPVTDYRKPLDQQSEDLGYCWTYDYADSVKEAMTPVVQEALRRVRNDGALDGISFQTTYGIHAFTPNPPLLKAAETGIGDDAVVARWRISASPTATKGYEFELDDSGWGKGIKVEILDKQNRTLTMKVHNSFFLYRSVYVRFLDVDQQPIAISDIPADQRLNSAWFNADTKYDSYRAMAKPRQRVMGIPVESESSREFSVTMPDSASYMEVLVVSPSMHSYVPANYDGLTIPADLQTYLLCYALPTFLLAVGIGTAMFSNGSKIIMVEQVASAIVEAVASPVMQAIMQSGQSAAEIGAYFWSMIPRMVWPLATPFALLLLSIASDVVADAMITSFFPITKAVTLAVAVISVGAEIIETTVSLSETPRLIKHTVSTLMPVKVVVGHDPNDYEFPAGALHYKITLTHGSGPPTIFESDLESPKVTTVEHTFSITSGGQITVEAQFTDPDTGWVGGYGKSEPQMAVLADGQDALAVSFAIQENLIPLTEHTSYHHVEKLAYQDGKHVWQPGAAPQSTVANLGGNQAVTLAQLDDITINMKGRLGYVWQGASPTLVPADGVVSGSTPLHTLQSINLEGDNPDQFLRILGTGAGQQTGFIQPIFMQYDLLGPVDGLHFVVAPRRVNNAWQYHAHRVSLADSGAIDLEQAPSWGCFASAKIRDIAVHPRGVLLALNADQEKVELLTLPDEGTMDLANAVPAEQAAGQGSYTGLLHGAKALALTLDGSTFLVLEEVNQRIQAFSVSNASVNYFDGQPHVALNQGQDAANTKVTYLDMSLEYGGYIYVLSYVNAGASWQDYRMDLYQPNGAFLTRVAGVAAAKLVVDKWRVVYTENFELLEGPQQRPEPSISTWAARAAMA